MLFSLIFKHPLYISILLGDGMSEVASEIEQHNAKHKNAHERFSIKSDFIGAKVKGICFGYSAYFSFSLISSAKK
jgi:hypothetical protein